MKHGGRSGSATLPVEQTAQEIYEALSESAPVRDADGEVPAADRALVELAALALCRVRSVSVYLGAYGYLDAAGEPRPAVKMLEHASSTCAELLASLGMSPAGRLKLGVDLVRGLSAAEELQAHLDAKYGDGAKAGV